MRCFFTDALDALGTRPDSKFNKLSEDLRDVLTVGRPIDVVLHPGRDGQVGLGFTDWQSGENAPVTWITLHRYARVWIQSLVR